MRSTPAARAHAPDGHEQGFTTNVALATALALSVVAFIGFLEGGVDPKAVVFDGARNGHPSAASAGRLGDTEHHRNVVTGRG